MAQHEQTLQIRIDGLDPESEIAQAIVTAIGKLDRSKPDGRSASGKPIWSIRGARIPFTHDALFGSPRLRAIAPELLSDVSEERRTAIQREVAEVELPEGCCGFVNGIASSTSVDWYGTEMTKPCLDDQSRQFREARPMTMSHGGFFSGPCDWDQVLGESTQAEVERVMAVENPYDATEPAYTLAVGVPIYDLKDGRDLCLRLAVGQKIGLSIGGWFVDVRVIADEETGEVERILVDRVELDHVAVTRRPANPDAKGLALMRSQFTNAIRSQFGLAVPGRVSEAPVPAAPQTRSAPKADDRGQVIDEEASEDMTGTHMETPNKCSLSVTEEQNRIAFALDPNAPEEEIRGAAVAIVRGKHGETASRVLRTALRAVRAEGGESDPGAEPVDESPPAGHDGGDTPADASSATPATEHAERETEEQPMSVTLSDDQFAELLRRVGGPAAAPAPATTPAATATPDARAAAPVSADEQLLKLRAELAEAKAKAEIAEEVARRAVREPLRRGVSGASDNSVGRKNVIQRRIDTYREKAPTFALASEEATFDIGSGKTMHLLAAGRDDLFNHGDVKLAEKNHRALENTLFSLLSAAEADGVLRQPEEADFGAF